MVSPDAIHTDAIELLKKPQLKNHNPAGRLHHSHLTAKKTKAGIQLPDHAHVASTPWNRYADSAWLQNPCYYSQATRLL